MDTIDFYQRVKKLAKTNKMTIETAVGQAGLSLASYNAYRRHENLPRVDEALKIAQALSTSVEYLVFGQDKASLTTEQRDLLETYENLDNDNREAVRSFMLNMQRKQAIDNLKKVQAELAELTERYQKMKKANPKLYIEFFEGKDGEEKAVYTDAKPESSETNEEDSGLPQEGAGFNPRPGKPRDGDSH
jgi:transcriptional regulator with XRE-family HTH domain